MTSKSTLENNEIIIYERKTNYTISAIVVIFIKCCGNITFLVMMRLYG